MLLTDILNSQSVSDADKFIRAQTSTTARLADLHLMLTHLTTVEPAQVQPNFLTFVLNQCVTESLREDADKTQGIKTALCLSDIFNGQTTLSTDSLIVPDGLFDVFAQALFVPMHPEQYIKFFLHLEWFWLADKLPHAVYKTLMINMLPHLQIHTFTSDDIILILRGLRQLEPAFFSDHPIGIDFCTQIQMYLREQGRTLDKKTLTDIITGMTHLKPKKTSTKALETPLQPFVAPTPVSERAQAGHKKLQELNLWPAAGFFPEHDTSFLMWRILTSEQYNLTCQNPGNETIKQEAIARVKAISGTQHREYVISYLLRLLSADCNPAYFDQLFFLFECGHDFLLHEPDSSAALFYAISRHSLPLFQFFVERLHLKIIHPEEIIIHPFLTIARLLAADKKHEPFYDYIDKNYWALSNETALITAIRYQDQAIFDPISNFKVNVPDVFGVTPLMHALQNTTPQARHYIDKLLTKLSSKDLLTTDNEGANALAYAIRYGHFDDYLNFLSKISLLSCDFSLDFAGLPNDDSVLLYALRHGRYDMAERLLQQGASLELLDNQGLSMVHHCLTNPALANALQWMISKNPALVADEERTREGDTALLYAAKHDCFWAIDLLCHAGADAHATNDQGMTLGHYLVLHNQPILLEACLSRYHLNIMAQNNASETLLDLAIHCRENIQMVRVCMTYLRQKHTPFNLKNKVNFFDVLAFLATLPEEGNGFIDEHGQGLLHLALLYGEQRPVILDTLINTLRLSVNQINAHQQTPLCVLIHHQLTDKAINFIETYAPKRTRLDRMNSSLLHLACEANNTTLVEKYIKASTKWILHARLGDGKTPLDFAFGHHNQTMIDLLWTHMENAMKDDAFKKFKANQQHQRIQYALEHGYQDPEVMLALPVTPEITHAEASDMRHQAEVESQRVLAAPEALSAVLMPQLDISVALPKKSIVYLPIEEIYATISVTKNIPTLRDIKKLLRPSEDEHNAYLEEIAPYTMSMLECAFNTHHYAVINQVLRFPCVDKEMTMDEDIAKRLLAIALGSGRGPIVRLALRLKALREIAHEHDNQALYTAIINNQHEVVQALLQVDAVKNSAHCAGNRALIAACRTGHLETIALLLSNPMVSELVPEGDALTIAIDTQHFDLVCQLLSLPMVRSSVTLAHVLQAMTQKNTDAFMIFVSLEHLKGELINNLPSLVASITEQVCDHILSLLVHHIPEAAQYLPASTASDDTIEPIDVQGLMEPVWLLVPTPYTVVYLLYPVLEHLDDIYDASMSGRLYELKSHLDTYVFPPDFALELYEILYLAVVYRQSHVVDYLLSNPTLASYTLERVNQLTARAIVNQDATMLRTLIKHDVIRHQLTSNYNYPLRCAARYDAVAMAKILLEVPEVKENAAVLNNKALRNAAERGSIEMVQLLCSINAVVRNISVFNNAPFRRAYGNGHHAVCMHLLQYPMVFQHVTQTKYQPILQSFVTQRLASLPDELALRLNHRIYALIACFGLRCTHIDLKAELWHLLQQPSIKKRAHLSITSTYVPNELLHLAKKHGHVAMEAYLMTLPQVQHTLRKTSASSTAAISGQLPCERFFSANRSTIQQTPASEHPPTQRP